MKSAAAYEVDDFQFVSVVERGLGPLIAGDDVAVEFDGEAIGLHAEGLDQGGQGCGLGGLRFAVDGQGEGRHF